MMLKILVATAILACATMAASAANVAKTYSYFSIGGSTLDEIEADIAKRGPHVKSSGKRHPGATQMEFTTRLTYRESKGRCEVVKADVTVRAKVILPRWKRNKKADRDVRLIWDTLESDIKRHEESHVGIAKNHARELEQALMAIGRQRDCTIAGAKAKAASARILNAHDRAQAAFDRVEGINFESRILRLLRYRMERIEDGRLPG